MKRLDKFVLTPLLLLWLMPQFCEGQGILGEPTTVPPFAVAGTPEGPSARDGTPVVRAQAEEKKSPADREPKDLLDKLDKLKPRKTSPADEILPLPKELPEVPPTPLPDKMGELKAPGLEAGDRPLPINLAAALKLADARPLIVAAAQAGVWVAEAELTRARLLWMPSLQFSNAYYRHDGPGPDLNNGLSIPGKPITQNVNYLYGGFGLINTAVETTDMIFQPLAARQVLNSRKWDIQTAKNDALLQTANYYFTVHEYRGRYAAALDLVAKGRKLVEKIKDLSEDLVPKAEVDRASRLLADLEQNQQSMRENWRVHSANLTQTLRLDPRAVILPLEQDHLQITLIDPGRPLDQLMPIGLLNRPELASQKALVESVVQKIRAEKWRPLLPSIYLNGFQTPGEKIMAGYNAIGGDSRLNNWNLRSDVTIQPSWALESLGFGNMARIKMMRGQQSQTIVELFKLQDMVAGDVTRSQAHLQSAAVRVGQAERSLREAITTFEKNYEGLKHTKRFGNVLIQVYRPQEVVIALEHLWSSYNEYFSTVADYNRSQFMMYHSLGYPAGELAFKLPPGNAVPVDTTRPAPLPPAGIGPPPATR